MPSKLVSFTVKLQALPDIARLNLEFTINVLPSNPFFPFVSFLDVPCEMLPSELPRSSRPSDMTLPVTARFMSSARTCSDPNSAQGASIVAARIGFLFMVTSPRIMRAVRVPLLFLENS